MPVNLSYTVPSPGADGVYPYAIPTQPGLPPAQPTNLIGMIGYGNWGPVNQAVYLNTLDQAIYYFGDSANIPVASGDATNAGNEASIVGGVQSAAPEGNYFACVRVGSTTSSDALAAASLVLLDASAGTVSTLAAAYEGTDGNSITLQINVLSGTFGGSNPVTVQAVVTIANRPTWTSQPFNAGATGYGGGAFKSNFAAQISGSGGAPPCPYLVYVSNGSSSAHPVTIVTTATGGKDGVLLASMQTYSSLAIGSNANIGSFTGMYALTGIPVNLFVLHGLVDLTQASTMAAFAQSNSCLAVLSLPSGETTTNALALQQTNSASSPWLWLANDFSYQNDVVDGTGPQYYDPAVKVAATVSQLQPWQDPSNKPYVGAQNFIGTIRSKSGQPYTNAELAQLQNAGIVVFNKPANRGNLWCLTHGTASDGVTPISDTRMLNYIANGLTVVLGAFVGESQTPIPPVGTIDTDATRTAARAAISSFMGVLANPNQPQIAAWTPIMDATNNSNATIAAGYLYTKIEVITLAGIKFILLGLQVGQTVTVVPA